MTLLKSTCIAMTLGLAVLPATAHAEVVEFAFKASELATDTTRKALLERIEARAKEACRFGDPFSTRKARKRCAENLTVQFVAAIDDEALTVLANGKNPALIRTALF